MLLGACMCRVCGQCSLGALECLRLVLERLRVLFGQMQGVLVG